MPQIFHAPQTEAPALLDEEGLIQRYEALPPRAKTVLHLKVTAGPYIEKDVLSRAASMVQIPMPDGRNLNSGVIGEIVGREKKSGLWDQINDPGSLVRHHVNIAAFGQATTGGGFLQLGNAEGDARVVVQPGGVQGGDRVLEQPLLRNVDDVIEQRLAVAVARVDHGSGDIEARRDAADGDR